MGGGQRILRGSPVFGGVLSQLPPVPPQSGQGTPEVTGWFEVTVGGHLVHSKKVGAPPPACPPPRGGAFWGCPPPSLPRFGGVPRSERCRPPQNGDGFVDSDSKLRRIVAAIESRLA